MLICMVLSWVIGWILSVCRNNMLCCPSLSVLKVIFPKLSWSCSILGEKKRVSINRWIPKGVYG